MRRYHYKNLLGEFRIYFCNYFIGYIPSHTIRMWYYRKVMKFKIAKDAAILIGCKFSCTQHLLLGEHSTINQDCHIDNRGDIEIGANVSISPKCNFITADHLMDSPTFEGRNRPIIIKDYAFIGFGATLLGGVTIGKGSVVGALGLVVKSTDAYGIYLGQPAKKGKERNKNLNYITNYSRLFH